LGEVDHQATAGAAEDGATGKDLHTDRRRHREVLIHWAPWLHSLRAPFDPLRQAGDYNVGQLVLFQEAQQLVLEEAGISSEQTDLLALSSQRESFFEKFLHPTGGSAVAAAEPAVEVHRAKLALKSHHPPTPRCHPNLQAFGIS
jgi:hypothetical protein